MTGSRGISEVGLNGDTSAASLEGDGLAFGDFEGDAAGLLGFGEDGAELGLPALVGLRVGISLSGESGIVGFRIDFGATKAAVYSCVSSFLAHSSHGVSCKYLALVASIFFQSV